MKTDPLADPAGVPLGYDSNSGRAYVQPGSPLWRPAPAAFFATSVVRRPARGFVTVQGGGWIASGPAHPTRLPVPVLPAGLRLLGTEGAGEVQTPLTGRAAAALRPGDRVWWRHAKAGELCEHVDELHLVRGATIERAVPTYRGDRAPAFL